MKPRLRHVVEIMMRNVQVALDAGVPAGDSGEAGPDSLPANSVDGSASSAVDGRGLPDPSASAGDGNGLHGVGAEKMGRLRDLPCSFFEIRVPGAEEPVYTSEVAPYSANPCWLPLQDRIKDLEVLRSGLVFLSVWVVSPGPGASGKRRAILRDLEIDLAGLVYLGKDLSSLTEYGPNTLLLLLRDGLYVYCASCARARADRVPPPWRVEESRTLRSYDSETILRLNQCQALVSEAVRQAQILRKDISDILEQRNVVLEPLHERDRQASETAALDKDAVVWMLEVDQESNQLRERRSELEHRRRNLAVMRDTLARRREELADKLAAQSALPESLAGIQNATRNRCGILVRELAEIYRIAAVKDRGVVAFTINGILLPNSDSPDPNPETTATALGYTCHMVCIVASYLRLDLRYPMRPMCSRSTVRDEISRLHKAAPEFPLFSAGQDKFRYGYGVFLLNKNIEQLMNHIGLTVSNLRHTVPNLHTLIKALSHMGDGTVANGVSHSIPPSPSNAWR
ncbi:UV radiation resistance protein and autophagy-related subunit 14-domain-containing protein [Hyaloraphidium curvatum]|nr:UV radiation resistance protein and autophagy-related subunit 14-domain-containing protein [Hyaloraphidium curvatum]